MDWEVFFCDKNGHQSRSTLIVHKNFIFEFRTCDLQYEKYDWEAFSHP